MADYEEEDKHVEDAYDPLDDEEDEEDLGF